MVLRLLSLVAVAGIIPLPVFSQTEPCRISPEEALRYPLHRQTPREAAFRSGVFSPEKRPQSLGIPEGSLIRVIGLLATGDDIPTLVVDHIPLKHASVAEGFRFRWPEDAECDELLERECTSNHPDLATDSTSCWIDMIAEYKGPEIYFRHNDYGHITVHKVVALRSVETPDDYQPEPCPYTGPCRITPQDSFQFHSFSFGYDDAFPPGDRFKVSARFLSDGESYWLDSGPKWTGPCGIAGCAFCVEPPSEECLDVLQRDCVALGEWQEEFVLACRVFAVVEVVDGAERAGCSQGLVRLVAIIRFSSLEFVRRDPGEPPPGWKVWQEQETSRQRETP